MMVKSARATLRQGRNLYWAVRYPRFFKLARDCKGMCSPLVYKKMYDLVYAAPDLDIIEVGGASGAGTIAMASAIKDANKKSSLICIEKCKGGSRSDIGSYQDNLNLINTNFKRFGVEDFITLFPRELTLDNGKEVISLLKTRNIGGLIHDADGRVDRDFFLFWPLLKPGGFIIVDDYVDKGKYLPISDRHPQGGMKKLLTFRLLNQMIAWGLFKVNFKIGATVFGAKPDNADFSNLDRQACDKIVEDVELERVANLEQQEKG